MKLVVEVTRSEIAGLNMHEERQLQNFVESVLSNTLTITDSDVEVFVEIVVNG
ncbi:hypothetical protein NVP1003O_24 [Vibrio phage 1.003.O._10N.286.48.A2]|nr:hypothetical protein NVP1003O_24 [Vibrio phage 1.003.O._10N.286.48.A2]